MALIADNKIAVNLFKLPAYSDVVSHTLNNDFSRIFAKVPEAHNAVSSPLVRTSEFLF